MCHSIVIYRVGHELGHPSLTHRVTAMQMKLVTCEDEETALAPQLPGGLDNHLEFGPLLFLGENIALLGRGKAALG
jgi:hypothetical protein